MVSWISRGLWCGSMANQTPQRTRDQNALNRDAEDERVSHDCEEDLHGVHFPALCGSCRIF